VQDWEYVEGLGDLDACNGRTGVVPIDGVEVTSYHYVLTNTYPYIPRCFHAAPDASFAAGTGGGGTTGPTSCTSTADCADACPAGSAGCTCASTPAGQRCVPTCSTDADCPVLPGQAFTCRAGTCVPSRP
jgi:hypothetical protein